MLHVISSLVIVLLVVGILLRKRNNTWHWRLMLTAFVIDIGLVLYIELTRHAVETVATNVNLLIWFHAGVSLAVIVLYLVMFALGRKLIIGNQQLRLTHRNVAIMFCACRGINYITSYWV